jgi:hypothetical protein
MSKQSKIRRLYFSERITEAMKEILDYPLTVVEAPIGYGKTTAVREYLCNSQVNILRQNVYDNSTNGFWNGLCSSLSKVDHNRSQSLAQLGFPNDKVSLQEAVKLIGEMKLPEKTVLFIDDYHQVNGTEVGNFIEFLVVNEINNLHIVLTARFIELPSMEELSLKGYLFHITKEIFELTPNEIINYYKMCGISLKKTEAEKLHSITEGWISALYLLMLNFKEKGSVMTTDNIYKLVENTVYKPFSEDIKEFLLNMCIFNSFTRKQAVHIWGNENAEVEKLLSVVELDRGNSFENEQKGLIIKKERLDVEYPVVEGLDDKNVEQYINSVLMGIVNNLIVNTGYYEDPKTDVTGRYHVRTNEKGILSISIEMYWFAGGAHGMTVLKSVTFDVNTGGIYRLEDLFKENVDYVKPLSDIIKRQIQERNIPLIVDFTQIRPDQDYYIQNRTLMIYFQLYELAPYVYGFVTFPITTREIEDIIREDGPLSILR